MNKSGYALATLSAPPGKGAEVLGRVLTGWSLSLVAGVPLASLVAGAASWRASYFGLALLLGASALLLSRRPVAREAPSSPGGLREALRAPGVAALLTACLLFMTAFYGTYAYLGDHARRVLGLSAGGAGLIVLAYGVGFGVGAFGDRAVDRIGAARLLPVLLAAVAAAIAGLVPGAAWFPALLALSAAWGFANHLALNVIVLRLTAACPDRRGAVLSLNSAVSYAGAFLGAGALGPAYEVGGFAAVALPAAALVAVAAGIAAVMSRRARSRALEA